MMMAIYAGEVRGRETVSGAKSILLDRTWQISEERDTMKVYIYITAIRGNGSAQKTR